MKQYAGIEVSPEAFHVCVVDAEGKIVSEVKVLSEPDALITWFAEHAVAMKRIGLEAGPLSRWLYAAMSKAGLAVELLETRHVRTAFKTMPVKTDKKDARHRAADAARMVSARTLQIRSGSGGPRGADGAQAAAGQVPRGGDEPAGHPCAALG